MPITWVRVRHEKHGGETDIPEGSVARYAARGWHPVGDEPPQPATQQQPVARQTGPAATTSTASTGGAESQKER